MKRRTFLALGLTAALSIPFAMTAFADGVQYKNGQTVEFSGHTDFGYFFTYTSGNGKVNYKCFSVVDNGKRKYAAVNEDLYEYFKAAFDDKDVVFKGNYQRMADDGSPVIEAYWEVQNTEKGRNLYRLENYVAPLLYQVGTAPNFKLFGELYDEATASASDDGSYLTLDSNPLNTKGGSIFFNDLGLEHIQLTNTALGLPDWLYQEMCQTRALDGRQKESFDNVTVSWTYHPDQGLEVMYCANA